MNHVVDPSTGLPSNAALPAPEDDGMLPLEVVARIRAKGVPFVGVRTPAGVVAIRKPTRAEYKRFMSQASDDKVVAMENLSKSCCEHPGAAELEKWFEQAAGISGSLANAALEMIGVEKDPEVKKY